MTSWTLLFLSTNYAAIEQQISEGMGTKKTGPELRQQIFLLLPLFRETTGGGRDEIRSMDENA